MVHLCARMIPAVQKEVSLLLEVGSIFGVHRRAAGSRGVQVRGQGTARSSGKSMTQLLTQKKL